ncbi:hypothetical protein [Aureibacter tunicatorum]|uniref:Uncharacterized protein n=1 Tax=Aureibacter tunicatorum TaxID=866807 RepID=A0AAE4BTT2_9BACT|nr:hypothetical protein [Aureibacter tunicatorum]MDR6240118.1 hypothetical protein [Aureibacter tunicatorum]BDD06001.1 hypothetical protein AUTU_34840 [Aureibacter tunicatorum]
MSTSFEYKDTFKTKGKSSIRKGQFKQPPIQLYHKVEPENYYPIGKQFSFERIISKRKRKLDFPYLEKDTYKLADSKTLECVRETKAFNNHQHTTPLIKEPLPFALPTLKVAQKGDLAIEADRPKARSFFSSPQQVENSNTKLGKINSPVRLHLDRENPLAVPDQYGTLNVTFPTTVEFYQLDKDMTEVSDCAQYAKMIMGQLSKNIITVVMGRPSKEDGLECVLSKEESLTNLVFKCFEAMRHPSELTAKEFSRNFHLKKTYSNHTRLNPAESDQRCLLLGVDRHAIPEVGEALRTMPYIMSQSNPNGFTSIESYKEEYKRAQSQKAASQQESSPITWNMHNAAVIARSGNDYICMENENQVYLRTRQFRNAFESMMASSLSFETSFFEFIRSKSDRFPSSIYKRAIEFEEFIRHFQQVSSMEKELQAQSMELLREHISLLKSPQTAMYFFRMFGTETGQSFHEVNSTHISKGAHTLRISCNPKDTLQSLKCILSEIMEHNLNLLPISSSIPQVDDCFQGLNIYYPLLCERLERQLNDESSIETILEMIRLHNTQLKLFKSNLASQSFNTFMRIYGLETYEHDSDYILPLFSELYDLEDLMSDKESNADRREMIDILLKVIKLSKCHCPMLE